MLRQHCCCLGIGLCLWWCSAIATDWRISGRAQVVDGDTLLVEGRVVDLIGIDALELEQSCWRRGVWWPCGRKAATVLSRFVAQDPVECNVYPSGKHNHYYGRCRLGSLDAAAEVMNLGYAVRSPPNGSDYRFAEREARNREVGMWGSIYVRPDKWRAGERLHIE